MEDGMACKLCSLKSTARLQHEDSVCLVSECAHCKGAPIAVLTRHTDKPSREERDHLFSMLRVAARKKYGKDEFFIDEGLYEYEGHYHAHARKL
jgi:hypothetical protein